jgi:D,D-heptose 1,7-bisphosphate phosphatase
VNKAIFLDRDGTIVVDVGYMNNPSQIEFIPGSIDALKKINASGYKAVVITNQAGVARGLLTEDMLQTIDKTLHKHILSGGAHLDALYYCPHHAEHGHYPYKQACECRKPHPGLLKKAERDLKIDLAQSFMIGDRTSDIEAGKRVGTKTVLILNDANRGEEKNLKEQPDHIAKNLLEAVNWILNGKH